MSYVAALKWPLALIFVVLIGRQIKGFRPEERVQALLMFLYFFLVITTFWILKPIKKTSFLQFYSSTRFDLFGWTLDGPGAEQIAKVLNMVVAFAAVTVFTLLARRLRRQQLTYALSIFFVLAYAMYSFLLNGPGAFTIWSFYLFGDLFSTLMVASFFAFLNDSVAPSAAKRLYGLVGLGGVLGGFFGSSVVGIYVKQSNPSLWMWVCLGVALAIALIAMAAGRIVDRNPPPEAETRPAAEKRQGSAALEGARLVFRSRYLLSIAAIVGLYEMVSTIMDFQFTSAVVHHLEGASIGQHFPRVISFTNLVALIVQLLLTSFVMTRFGVGTALLFLPVAALLGSAGFLIAPVLLIGSFLNTSDNGLSYSINQSAKEVLYVPTTRDEKYKAKAFIDMFVQRFAKALAVGVNLLIATLFSGFGAIRWLSLATIVILVVWIAAARYAGRAFGEKESQLSG